MEFEEKPAAAASLAQVYRAKIRSTGQWVAVKVQRPEALEQISKDLYVLQRYALGISSTLVANILQDSWNSRLQIYRSQSCRRLSDDNEQIRSYAAD